MTRNERRLTREMGRWVEAATLWEESPAGPPPGPAELVCPECGQRYPAPKHRPERSTRCKACAAQATWAARRPGKFGISERRGRA